MHEVSEGNQPEVVCGGTFYLLDGLLGIQYSFVWWCPLTVRYHNLIGACIVKQLFAVQQGRCRTRAQVR